MIIIRAKIIKVNVVMILTSVEFELLKTFISIFFEVIFDRITANGKGIGEGRATANTKCK